MAPMATISLYGKIVSFSGYWNQKNFVRDDSVPVKKYFLHFSRLSAKTKIFVFNFKFKLGLLKNIVNHFTKKKKSGHSAYFPLITMIYNIFQSSLYSKLHKETKWDIRKNYT